MNASSRHRGSPAGGFGSSVAAGVAVLLVLAFSTLSVADSSLRCDNAIISLGAASRHVRDICGRPDRIESWQTARNQYIRQFYDYKNERWILPELVVGPIRMERWTYDFGSHKFIRYLYFQNGELTRIKTGDKGPLKP